MRTQAGESRDELVTEVVSGPASALDELRPGQQAGRYIIVRRIGAGGMGVVYLAYDHELLRQVAIKILHHDVGGSGGSARIRREAQALAQLSHPNVVHVYEVSTVAERVFVAMEFVPGDSLRQWVARQTDWRTVVEAFCQAGRGLAAAHAAGLVHRDFKPENVRIDAEGRARVVDFGLARIYEDASPSSSDGGAASHHDLARPLTRAGSVVGTVPYMAPEQHRGRSGDASVDQYAFCVALWEALSGRRPFSGDDASEVLAAKMQFRLSPPPEAPPRPPHRSSLTMPAWIRRILVRGLDPDRARRFASMNDLLAALTKDPTVARRRVLSYAGVAASAVGIAVIPFAVAKNESRSCQNPVSELRVWWHERSADAEEAMLGTGVAYAEPTWEAVRARVDAHVEQWAAAREQLCSDRAADVPLTERGLACLDGRRRELRAFVDVLAQADGDVVRRAVEAAEQLPAVSSCRDSQWLMARVKPPDDPGVEAEVRRVRETLAEATALRRSGKPTEAAAVAEPLLGRAETLDYGPLVAEVAFELGMIASLHGSFERARRHLEQAYLIASEHHHDDVAARAATDNLFVVADGQYHLEEAEDWLRHATMAVRRAGRPAASVTRLHNSIGVLRTNQGRYDEAAEAFRTAVALEESLLDELGGTTSLAGTLSNFGDLLSRKGEYERAEGLHRRALDLIEGELGRDHPDYADFLTNLANVLRTRGRYDEARELFDQALAIYEDVLGPDHLDTAAAHQNIGTLEIRLGNFDEAQEKLELALAIVVRTQGKRHPAAADLLNNLGLVSAGRGHHVEAMERYTEALQIERAVLGDDHPDVADTMHNRGASARFLGRLDASASDLERSLAIRTKMLGPEHARVASSHVELGTVRYLQGRFEESREHLGEALRLQRQAYGLGHAEAATTLTALGALEEAQGNLEVAIENMQEGLTLFEKAVGPDHVDAAITRYNLARVLASAGNLDDAQSHVDRVVESWTQGMGPQYPYLPLAWALQAEIALARGNDGEARELLQQAIDEGVGLPDSMIARARFLYARMIWNEDRTRARTLAIESRRGFASEGPRGEAHLRELDAWAKGVGLRL